MKLRLNVYKDDADILSKFGSVARAYAKRLNVSNSMLADKDFCHDWLTEFYWKSLDPDHKLIVGLRGLLKKYDFLKREKAVIGGQIGEALGDQSGKIPGL
jgi:hypothetical protein